MALSAFDDKSNEPQTGDLKKVLGKAAVHWDALTKHIAEEYGPLSATWNYSGTNWGWSLRLKQKKRTVLYMTPRKGSFVVGLVLGEKAVKVAQRSTISTGVLTLIDEARKYAEGRAIRIEVRDKKDREDVEKVARIKMTN